MNRYFLRQQMLISTIAVALRFKRPFSLYEAPLLRGFFGNLLEEDVAVHNHNDEGIVYSYPRVQYKSIDSAALIIGLGEGVDTVRQMAETKEVNLTPNMVDVETASTVERDCVYGISKGAQDYSFFSPWLPLNQKNYEKYQMLGTWGKRKGMLENILVGNLISMSKSLGYTVPGPVKADIHKMEEVKTSLKGTPMLGFLGHFSVNFEIPDYWGIGKSVSRGFGTVKRIPDEKPTNKI